MVKFYMKEIFFVLIILETSSTTILDESETKQTKLNDDLKNNDSPPTENVFKDGPVKFEIIGDTSHLFDEEDFQKKEANLLYNSSSADSNNSKSNSTNQTIDTLDLNVLNKKSTISSNPHAECLRSNLTSFRETNIVKLVNGSRLTQILSESESKECFLVLFYVPWCPFSAKLAPIFNALPRAFLNLDILAFDVSKSIGYNTKFGTSAVPMIILFQNKNIVAKFNYTHKNLTDYIDFVSNKTGFMGNKSITINEIDLEGPVPTISVKGFDYYLLLSWIFLIFVSSDYIIRKTKFKIYLLRFLRLIILKIRPINLQQLNEPTRLQAIENIPNNPHPHPHND